MGEGCRGLTVGDDPPPLLLESFFPLFPPLLIDFPFLESFPRGRTVGEGSRGFTVGEGSRGLVVGEGPWLPLLLLFFSFLYFFAFLLFLYDLLFLDQDDDRGG